MNAYLCSRTLVFLLFSPSNHLMTPLPHMDPVTLGPTPQLGISGLSKVETSSSKMLLTQ